jgi:excinuclease UvrABC nuclease subunit
MLLDPLAMSSVELDNLNQLPDCSAIYFAIDSQNRILYIGQAVNLLTRWKNHHRIYQLQEINRVRQSYIKSNNVFIKLIQ